MQIDIPPGVVAEPTDSRKSANWKVTNFMRWSGTRLIPIYGWERYGFTAPTGDVRAIHTWRALDGREWTAYLTDSKVYVEFDDDLYDISPAAALEPYVQGAGGYGDYLYDYDDYGDARPAPGSVNFGPCFTLDNWGEDLLIMSSVDGRLLRWVPPIAPASPTACDVVPNAPVGCRTFVVTPERFVQVFCPAGDTSSYAWCDQEDIEEWTPGVSTKAGELPVEPASPVIGAIFVEAGTVFITARRVYVSEFIGLPYIYNTLDQAAGASPISAASMKAVIGGAIWVSKGGYWRLSGLSVEPMECLIWSWIDENIDWNLARAISIGTVIETLSEYWFSFPSKGSSHNDKTAVFNFRDGWWAMHEIGRSAGFSSNYASAPKMADRTQIYKHESGVSFADTALLPYAETFSLNAVGGEKMSTVRQIQPEIEGDTTNLRFSFAVKTDRTKVSTYTPKRRVQLGGYVDIDETARDFRLRVEQIDVMPDQWTMGPVIVDAVPRGKTP